MVRQCERLIKVVWAANQIGLLKQGVCQLRSTVNNCQ